MLSRILVTHGIGFLPEVDKIIVLKNGTVRKSDARSEGQHNLRKSQKYCSLSTTPTAQPKLLNRKTYLSKHKGGLFAVHFFFQNCDVLRGIFTLILLCFYHFAAKRYLRLGAMQNCWLNVATSQTSLSSSCRERGRKGKRRRSRRWKL